MMCWALYITWWRTIGKGKKSRIPVFYALLDINWVFQNTDKCVVELTEKTSYFEVPKNVNCRQKQIWVEYKLDLVVVQLNWRQSLIISLFLYMYYMINCMFHIIYIHTTRSYEKSGWPLRPAWIKLTYFLWSGQLPPHCTQAERTR